MICSSFFCNCSSFFFGSWYLFLWNLAAIRAYDRCQIGVGFDTRFEREPLFPLCTFPNSSEPDGQGLILSSPASKKKPKKTMSATLIEKAKNQSVALVPREIAKLAQRFCLLFNPALYPHKPPPAALTSRVLFTDSEDEWVVLFSVTLHSLHLVNIFRIELL